MGLKLTNGAQDHWKFHWKGATRGQEQSQRSTFTRFDMRGFKHIIVPESLQLTFLLFPIFY